MAGGTRELTSAIRAPWLKSRGLGSPAFIDYAMDNDFGLKSKGADGTTNVEMMRVGTGSELRIGHEAINPMWKTVQFNLTANGSLATQGFFVADRAYQIQGITYVHKTAGTDGSAVTCNVTHETGTQAAGAGTTVQSGTFNCKGTVNVVQTATLAASPDSQFASILTLNAGERLSVVFTGALTSLAGVVIEVQMTPCSVSSQFVYFVKANADLSTQTIGIANRDMILTRIDVLYSTAFVAAATIDFTKDTSTNAPGAGTSVLAATVASDATANTVRTPTLAATAATLRFAPGDRLAIKYSATTTGVGVIAVATFQPLYGRKEVNWQVGPNAQQAVDQCFFTADRSYEVIDLSCTFATAAGGAQKLLVTIDKATTAPGAGIAVHTDNASAGFDMNATANTVQFGTLTTLRNRFLMAGDRLGLKNTGAAQSIANANITVSLQPR